MRFLVDESLSPTVTAALEQEGHEAVHVRTLGLAAADDEAVLAKAIEEGRTLVTADLDFGALLAKRRVRRPSVIILRLGSITPQRMCDAVLKTVRACGDALESGVVAITTPGTVRLRKLPVRPED